MGALMIEHLTSQYDSIRSYWIESPKPGIGQITFYVYEPEYYADLLEGLDIKNHIETYRPIGIIVDFSVEFVDKDFDDKALKDKKLKEFIEKNSK